MEFNKQIIHEEEEGGGQIIKLWSKLLAYLAV